MKGILLHGGQGTRLRPLTHTGPKQLIPVAGKPISQHCLEDLKAAGVTDVAIILGDIGPEKVIEYYGDGSRLGLKLTYIRQGAPRGLAHAVSLAESFVGNDRFVVYLGDNLLRRNRRSRTRLPRQRAGCDGHPVKGCESGAFRGRPVRQQGKT